ncbi:hypothetical protein ACQZV8_20795 [Magnetococcales bacterium HHB-1]
MFNDPVAMPSIGNTDHFFTDLSQALPKPSSTINASIDHRRRPPNGGHPQRARNQPNFKKAAISLNLSENQLRQALSSQPPYDFPGASRRLDIDEGRLHDLLGIRRPRHLKR